MSLPNYSVVSSLDAHGLHEATLRAAKNEKVATLVLLEHLAEVDRRRLYADRAYSSLFEYVHKALGYSEGQASERVSAMRLLRKVPEVKAALESGRLTLTSTAKLASHVRRENSTVPETISLLERCEGKSSREVERVLVENSTRENPSPDRLTAVGPGLTRITFEVDADFLALVARMKELDGNPVLPLRAVFQRAMREYINRRTVKLPKTSSPIPPLRAASRAPEVKPRSRYIPAATKSRIRLRSSDQCEYRDPETGRRCASRHGLQYDHIHPFGKGGDSITENLRHLCRTHNLQAASREYGEEKMRTFFKQ